jgi:tetratricopeptide (TPR) repeat protein
VAIDALIDRVEASASASEVRQLLRANRGTDGLCQAFFGRLVQIYAADPGRASRLARHWQAFRDHGDDAALAYRAKGAADRLDGRWLASARAFERAGELAGDEVSRLTHPIGAIDGLAKAARIDAAVELGQRLATGLDALGQPALAARARLNTANALLHAERGAEARSLYAQAIPVFAAEGMPLEEAMARLGLSTTQLYGGDPALARTEAQRAGIIAREEELDYLAALCDMNLAHVAIVSGGADEAFATLRALRGALSGSPADAARLEESVGDACLRLNLLDEAEEAYRAALAVQGGLPAVDRAHVLLGLGETLSVSDPDAAGRFLTRAAAVYRSLGNSPWRSVALAARAELSPRRSRRLADEAVALAQGSPYHETIAHLARATTHVACGIDPRSDLRKAEGHLRKYGFRRFAWRVHALRARAATAPLPHFRRMFEEVLRDRLVTTSVAARSGFFRDKTEAVGEYLTVLLANPTPRRVAEARDVIRQTRGATLLEEILFSGSLKLNPVQMRRLEELRAEVAQDATEENIPDARGLATPTHPPRRKWTEATHVVGALEMVLPPTMAHGCVVMAEAGGDLWALAQERAIRLPISARELSETLRWLAFELQTPTADRDAPSDEALALLAELREALVLPWRGAGNRPVRISPDGILWRVPWDAILGDGPATPILLHPSLGGGDLIGKLEKVALWIDTPADLPNTLAEEKTVLARFPNAQTFRSRAEIVTSLDQSWDLIHVAGHARHREDNPMFSALEFPDGPIYASEIARSGLRTRLACLSACETGTLSLATRQEPDGLARAFLARGAEAVLASLWPLDDEAASLFFGNLYNDLGTATNLPRAVSGARSAVRAWRDHPYFWAPLSLFGGYCS